MRRISSGKPWSLVSLLALVGTLLWLSTGPASAVRRDQSDQKGSKADKEGKVSTVTYGVADLLENAASWRPSFALVEKPGSDNLEALARLIMLSIDPQIW